MLIHWAATYILILPTYHKQQQLLPYGSSEGTHHLAVLSDGEPFKSQCSDGQGLVVDGCQPSAMGDGIVPNLNGFFSAAFIRMYSLKRKKTWRTSLTALVNTCILKL